MRSLTPAMPQSLMIRSRGVVLLQNLKIVGSLYFAVRMCKFIIDNQAYLFRNFKKWRVMEVTAPS